MAGSIILTIGGLILLGIFLVTANSVMSENAHTADQNEYMLTAMSLGQSVIDEAKTKSFDQQTIGGPVPNAAALTPSAMLGPDGAGEIIVGVDSLVGGRYASTTRFNDVDDYNNYSRLVNTPRAEGFLVTVQVQYASEISPDVMMITPTFCKTMIVSVNSPFIPVPVRLQYAFTY